MATSPDDIPMSPTAAGDRHRHAVDDTLDDAGNDTVNNEAPPPYEPRQTPPYKATPDGTSPASAAAERGEVRRRSRRRFFTQSRLAGAGALIILIIILATVIPMQVKNKGDSVNLPTSTSPTATAQAQTPPTGLPESRLAVIPGATAGTDALIYQNPAGDLTLYNTGEPMVWTMLLGVEDVLSGSPMAAAYFPRSLAFPGTKPLSVDYSYIFYLNPSGNPTFLSATSSDYAFKPQDADDVLARPSGNNTGISTLAATPMLGDANGPVNSIEWFACTLGSPAIQQYTVSVGDPAPKVGGNSTNIFSDVICPSMTFVEHGGISYYLALTRTNASTIQMFYKNTTDSNGDWKVGAQLAIGLPSGNQFCAAGELLAWQDDTANLRGASIVFDDNEPAKTTFKLSNGEGMLTVVTRVPMHGTILACRWRDADDMAIYHQNEDSTLGAYRMSPKNEGFWMYDPLDCTNCGF